MADGFLNWFAAVLVSQSLKVERNITLSTFVLQGIRDGGTVHVFNEGGRITATMIFNYCGIT
jgi:hypothetical protein